mgnify:CR=1 FL=1
MTHPIDGVQPEVPPSGTGCAECLATGQWWLHLRRCALCGHVGCCDNSPHQHARRHHEHSAHPVIASYEPGEDWLYDYRDDRFFTGPTLAAPRWRPAGQPVPGPEGRVPADWRSRLHP